MMPLSTFRVRWFREIGLSPAVNFDPQTIARDATQGNPGRAATVETDGGDGPALVIAVGGGDLLRTDYFDDPYDPAGLVVRTWEVEDAAEEIGTIDAPDMLLGEFREAFQEQGVTGVRLLLAEENTPDGAPVILAASLFDCADFENEEDGDWLEQDE
jgi:hypothetical protein